MLGLFMRLLRAGCRLTPRACRSSALIVPAVALSVLCVAASGGGEKRMKPLTREEVAQTWVGLSEDELYLVRVDLAEDGLGSAGYVFAQEEPRLFRITSWKYVGDRVEIVLSSPLLSSPHEQSLEVPRLAGKLIGNSMALTMEGRDWSRRLNLRPEADLEQRWSRLRQAMPSPAK